VFEFPPVCVYQRYVENAVWQDPDPDITAGVAGLWQHLLSDDSGRCHREDNLSLMMTVTGVI